MRGRGRGRGRSRSVSDLPGPQRHACVDHAVLGGPAARSAAVCGPHSTHVQSTGTHNQNPQHTRPAHCSASPTPSQVAPAPAPAPFASSANQQTNHLRERSLAHDPPVSNHISPPPLRPAPTLRESSALPPPPRAAQQHLFTTDGTCNVHAATAPPQRNETKASVRRHRPATREEEVRPSQHRLKGDDDDDASPSRCTQQSDTSNRARPRSRSSARRRLDGTVRPFAVRYHPDDENKAPQAGRTRRLRLGTVA